MVLFVGVLFKVGGCLGVLYYMNIFVGIIVIKNVVDLYVYLNIVYVVLVNGVEIKEWLEWFVG